MTVPTGTDRPTMWLDLMRDHERCSGSCATCELFGALTPRRLAELGAAVRADMPARGKPGVRRDTPRPDVCDNGHRDWQERQGRRRCAACAREHRRERRDGAREAAA